MNPAAPTQCTKMKLMLHGFVDGELDAAHSLQIEQHIANCSHCLRKMEGLQALKQLVGQKGVQWRTPDHVRAQVLEIDLARGRDADAIGGVGPRARRKTL